MERPAGYSSLRRIGDFKHSARLADHDGWMLCDGRAIKRTAHPRFFAAIGATAATLTLPEGKDCLLVGAGGRLKVLERGGTNQIVLTIDHLPEHDHSYSDSTATATAGKSSLLSGLLTFLSGLTVADVAKRTGKAGKASPTPIRLEPLAIGANVFIYTGEPIV